MNYLIKLWYHIFFAVDYFCDLLFRFQATIAEKNNKKVRQRILFMPRILFEVEDILIYNTRIITWVI